MARIISCLGAGAVNASFKPKSTITKSDVGKAVTLTANNEVGLGSSQDALVGRLAYLDDAAVPTVCTVQIAGVMEVPYSGSPAIKDKVVVNGAGGVATAPTMSAGQPCKGSGIVLSIGTTKLLLNL